MELFEDKAEDVITSRGGDLPVEVASFVFAGTDVVLTSFPLVEGEGAEEGAEEGEGEGEGEGEEDGDGDGTEVLGVAPFFCFVCWAFFPVAWALL